MKNCSKNNCWMSPLNMGFEPLLLSQSTMLACSSFQVSVWLKGRVSIYLVKSIGYIKFWSQKNSVLLFEFLKNCSWQNSQVKVITLKFVLVSSAWSPVISFALSTAERGLHRWYSGEESICQCRRHKRLECDLWVGKVLWSRKWQPTPVFLPENFHGQGSLASCSPCDHKESIRLQRHNWAMEPAHTLHKTFPKKPSPVSVTELAVVITMTSCHTHWF